tara:strand:+ start:173 stop:559 length:387 start_codon:yes stop_codon:yes gene_type:complete
MKWFLLALRKSFVLKGRSRRKEYWMLQLFCLPIIYILAVVGVTFKNNFILVLFFICCIGVAIPSFSCGIRRLHDINRSGWWTLLNITPLTGFILFVLFMFDGTVGENKYGPDPKECDELAKVEKTLLK